ncbi:uncharacterized protein LOC122058702 isoform X1 [Macadamia integrifolia]|uniref:uncharacterized protein LOC122058702 isoform X1 n=2 Tax=Macadamia integrifolia TaxID=60698 RepID=UPI001C4F8221|nr:uncharacterized protein LOC122058702 isoform X1 [Macadamia integrifolia]
MAAIAMGKRKIPIEKIDDKKKVNVTFSKRRKGLFGKALNTSGLCNAKIAMVVFSPAGNPYTFVTPTSSVDDVIDQYLNNIPFKEITEVEWEGKKDREQLNQCSCEGKKVGFWWDLVDVDKYRSLEELQILRSSLESLRESVCQKLDNAHAEQLLGVEDVNRDVAASDFGLSSCPLYSTDESKDDAASDFVTDLSSCLLSSADEDVGTVFATVDDESCVDWIVSDDSEGLFDHIFYDNSDSATISDFISDKATYPMSGADEDDWIAADDSEAFFDHLFDDNSAGATNSAFISGKTAYPMSDADEDDCIVADDSADFFDHLFDDNSAGAITFDFIGDKATYPMSGVDGDAIKGLSTNDDKSYGNETVQDNSSYFFEKILSFWS